jgi:prepilin-type N-terminal cleavage/methylation domain-containing protein
MARTRIDGTQHALLTHSTDRFFSNVEATLDREGRDLRARRIQGGFTLIELMMVTGIIGLLASIAIPTFMQYQSRARTSEAKATLGAIYTGEIVYFTEEGRYGSLGEIRYVLTGSNRYTYRTGAAGIAGGGNANVTTPGLTQDTSNASFGTVEAEGTVVAMNGATSFTVTAVANLDGDSTIDRWHVNERRLGLQAPDSSDVAN